MSRWPIPPPDSQRACCPPCFPAFIHVVGNETDIGGAERIPAPPSWPDRQLTKWRRRRRDPSPGAHNTSLPAPFQPPGTRKLIPPPPCTHLGPTMRIDIGRGGSIQRTARRE